jgi:hypothetical protein
MDSEYIKESHKQVLKENKEKYLHGKLLYIQDPFLNDIDIDYVIEYVEEHVPLHLMHYVDSIYVGNFNFLNERDVNALYMDNAIYITNDQSSEKDMIDDIVHEIAHSIEETIPEEIHFDGEVEREFLGKRERLCFLFRH